MGRKRFTAEQIVDKLRQAEVAIAKGSTIGEVSKKLGISDKQMQVSSRQVGSLTRVGLLQCKASLIRSIQEEVSHQVRLFV